MLLGFVDASVAVDFHGAKGFFKAGEFGLGEGDFGGFEVFEDSFFVLGSRDRDDVGVFIEHPCEGNLRGRGFFLIKIPIKHAAQNYVFSLLF